MGEVIGTLIYWAFCWFIIAGLISLALNGGLGGVFGLIGLYFFVKEYSK